MLTVNQAATELGVSPHTIYALLRAGRLAHVRIGLGRGIIRILHGDLQSYIESSRVEAEPAQKHGSVRRIGSGPRARETHGL